VVKAARICYEYKTLPLTTAGLSERELNELGRQGWLLTATLPQLIFVRALDYNVGARSPLDQPRLLAVKDVCARLQMSRSKVYELLASGALKSMKVGRLTRVPAAELDRFIVEGLEESR
jgi:excisionase family DNA binding protein